MTYHVCHATFLNKNCLKPLFFIPTLISFTYFLLLYKRKEIFGHSTEVCSGVECV